MRLTKKCTRCNQAKPLLCFSVRRASKDGLSYVCRECQQVYRMTNREAYQSLRRASYEANREQEKAKALAYYKNNRLKLIAQHAEYMQKTAEQQKNYRSRTVADYRARLAKRRAALALRTPAWLTPAQLRAMTNVYRWAREVEKATGIPHHVDHIVPLRGVRVSGLHVPSNLQILSATANIAKNNRYE